MHMDMTKQGILFVISGPSGVGKGTIKNALLKVMDDLQESISATTRKPRKGEVHGREYYFYNKETFLSMIEDGELLEYAHVYDNMYGTPKSFVLDSINHGQDIILEIDIQGAMQIKKMMPDGVFIFIQPPSKKELARRLTGRGKDSEDSIKTRLAACEEEMAQVQNYDYAVVNDKLDGAIDKIRSIVLAERCRVKNID